MLGGGNAPRRLQRLSSYQKKFVVFAIETHCDEYPTIPLFPVGITTLMEFATWCAANGINGWDSIRGYVGAAVGWSIDLTDQPDPRSATPQNARTWLRFVHNFPSVVGGPPPKIKLRIQPGHLEAIHLDMTEASWIDRRD